MIEKPTKEENLQEWYKAARTSSDKHFQFSEFKEALADLKVVMEVIQEELAGLVESSSVTAVDTVELPVEDKPTIKLYSPTEKGGKEAGESCERCPEVLVGMANLYAREDDSIASAAFFTAAIRGYEILASCPVKSIAVAAGEDQAAAIIDRAQASIQQGKLSTAIEDSETALKILNEEDHPEPLKLTLLTAASFQSALAAAVEGDARVEASKKSKAYGTRAMALSKKTDGEDSLGFVKTVHNMGSIQEQLGEPKFALVYFQKALSALDKMKEKSEEAAETFEEVLMDTVRMSKEVGKHVAAQQLLSRAIEWHQSRPEQDVFAIAKLKASYSRAVWTDPNQTAETVTLSLKLMVEACPVFRGAFKAADTPSDKGAALRLLGFGLMDMAHMMIGGTGKGLANAASGWKKLEAHSYLNEALPALQQAMKLLPEASDELLPAIDDVKMMAENLGPIICGGCRKPIELKKGAEIMRCARCRAVAYHSVDCQKAHWPTHKTKCSK